jgi:hypothetical protein
LDYFFGPAGHRVVRALVTWVGFLCQRRLDVLGEVM